MYPSYYKNILRSSNTLATWCKEPPNWKRPWCWERLKAGEEGRGGWDGWMASLTQWTRIRVNSGRWWRSGKPGTLQSMGSQWVRQDLATEQQQMAFLFSLVLPTIFHQIPTAYHTLLEGLITAFSQLIPQHSVRGLFLRHSLPISYMSSKTSTVPLPPKSPSSRSS